MKQSQRMVSENSFKNRSQKILSQHDLNKWPQTKIPKIFKRRPQSQEMVLDNGVRRKSQTQSQKVVSKSGLQQIVSENSSSQYWDELFSETTIF